MKDVLIFVEGIADFKFIQDYIRYLFDVKLGKDRIVEIGGCNQELLNKSALSFRENTDKGGTNLLIFDADDNFEEKIKGLEIAKKALGLEFEIFLFPNNELPGDLEILLCNIINLRHNDIFECWKNYENCLQSSENSYTLPARKTKIYAYLEALVGRSNSQKEKIKERNRNYRNTEHWNLDIDYLHPLKTFLHPHFITT